LFGMLFSDFMFADSSNHLYFISPPV